MTEEKKEIPLPRNKNLQEIMTLLKARKKFIYVVTHEERRFIEDFHDNVADPMNLSVWTWSTHQGLMKYEDHKIEDRAKGEFEKTFQAPIALQKIKEMQIPKDKRGMVFLMRDMHTVLSQGIPRQIRDLLNSNTTSCKTIIITAPELGFSSGSCSGGLPLILDKETIVIDYNLMGKEEIKDFIQDKIRVMNIFKEAKKKSNIVIEYTQEEIDSLTQACQGLTEPEIDIALKSSWVEYKRLNTEKIIRIKEQLVKKSQILEFVSDETTMADVGGLDKAKEYFETYRNSFSEEAKAFGVEPPTGIILTGVPGTGKSLLAKAICKAWGLPGIRLDIGKVMTGLVGGSEGKMREAIKQAEALAPAVLWIDEVEKAMSGVKSSNFSDAGTMSRVFGTFLTWMQEKKAEVVILATANDITQVPPEFIRRFNETFFVDIPTNNERDEIFRIHLQKRNRTPSKFNLKKLVKASMNYTGAEIEKAIQHAIAEAFNKGDKQVKTKHVLQALEETKPLYTVMGEKVAAIRSWARDRARYASSEAEAASQPGKQKVSIGDKAVDLDNTLDLTDITTPNVETKKKSQKTKEESEDLVL